MSAEEEAASLPNENTASEAAAAQEEADIIIIEPDSPPPVVTRTRSGRVVRTPSALLGHTVKTPARRARRSTVKELPEENNVDLEEDKCVIPPALENGESTEEPKKSVPSTVPLCPEPAAALAAGTNRPNTTNRETDASPPSTVRSPATQMETVRSPATPMEMVQSPATPMETVRSPATPMETVRSPATPMETPPTCPDKTMAKKKRHSESEVKHQNPVIPLGKPKSGRVWKDRNKQRFSAMVQDKPLRTTWEKKMAAKRDRDLVKKYALQLKEDQAREKTDKRKRREENLKRRAENERKSEIVQVIQNTTKIKRMKKKQLRKIEKRDTLALLQKSQPKMSKPNRKERRSKIQTNGETISDLS